METHLFFRSRVQPCGGPGESKTLNEPSRRTGRLLFRRFPLQVFGVLPKHRFFPGLYRVITCNLLPLHSDLEGK